MSAIVLKMSKEDFQARITPSQLRGIEEDVKQRYNEEVSLVHLFPVLYQGWECDDTAFLIQTSSGRLLAYGTNHGGIQALNAKDLKEKAGEYRLALKLTNRAIRALEREKSDGRKKRRR